MKQIKNRFGLIPLSKQHGAIPCIWKQHPKGVRAGNSPVWKGENERADSLIIAEEKLRQRKIKKFVEAEEGLAEDAHARGGISDETYGKILDKLHQARKK